MKHIIIILIIFCSYINYANPIIIVGPPKSVLILASSYGGSFQFNPDLNQTNFHHYFDFRLRYYKNPTRTNPGNYPSLVLSTNGSKIIDPNLNKKLSFRYFGVGLEYKFELVRVYYNDLKVGFGVNQNYAWNESFENNDFISLSFPISYEIHRKGWILDIAYNFNYLLIGNLINSNESVNNHLLRFQISFPFFRFTTD